MRSATSVFSGGDRPAPMAIVSLTEGELQRLKAGKVLTIGIPDGSYVAVMMCPDEEADRRFAAIERRDAGVESKSSGRSGNA